MPHKIRSTAIIVIALLLNFCCIFKDNAQLHSSETGAMLLSNQLLVTAQCQGCDICLSFCDAAILVSLSNRAANVCVWG